MEAQELTARRDTTEFAGDAIIESIGLALAAKSERAINHWLNAAEGWMDKYDERGGDRAALEARLKLKFGSDLRLPQRPR